MSKSRKVSPYAIAAPLPWHAITWTNGFWKDVSDSNAHYTVPHLQTMFESNKISHVIENFRICAGDSDGPFDGTDFGDGDFYKWMEAAIYTAAYTQNSELFSQIDRYIDLIARSQQNDGYISTKQIIGERRQNGTCRFGNINDFEVYNFGHLFTAACAHKHITGKDSFLNIAVKAADYLDSLYRKSALTNTVQTAVCPSHYMGLIDLYRTTGEKKYMDLASLAIRLRDFVPDGSDDNQDRIPLKEHKKIVGHAVRANYLYAGVADLYAETGDSELLPVIHSVWNNLMHTKLYITGGCGALYNGASPYGNFFSHQLVHQAYGYEYQLPNITAYNETCASIGHVLWAYRMFLIEPKAEYFDAIERAMLNTNLAAVSLDGEKFFYENMLRRTKKLEYKLIWPTTRSRYIESFCCPPNLARIIAESSQYTYCCCEDEIWLGLYGANIAEISLANGALFSITQTTDYPYNGEIDFDIVLQKEVPFKINLRIPHWAESGIIEAGETSYTMTPSDKGSYFSVNIHKNTHIHMILDMPVRFTISHPMVEENSCQAAVERGPLVYCIESADTKAESLRNLIIDLKAEFSPFSLTIKNRRITALKTHMYQICYENYSAESLYQPISSYRLEHTDVTLIPYFAWDNRGEGEMQIWTPVAYQ